MDKKLNALKQKFYREFNEIKKLEDIDKIKITYSGKKGHLTILIREIPKLSKNDRQKFGPKINDFKTYLETAIEEKLQSLKRSHIEKDLQSDWFDITLPSKKIDHGHLNPVTKIIWDLADAFEKLGYQILEGPEIETEWYNFEALNIPKGHPARDLQDTFLLENGYLPLTHTSAMQVRVMEKLKPPFKIAVPGVVYRSEKEDATHSSVFYHFEGFAVARNLSFSDLKGTLKLLMQMVLGEQTKLKFRASYFPYVEPCAEMSASCPHCQTKGCKACGGSGWLEILGAGMIHPNVLRNANINPDIYFGFAFCFGPTRLAMIKYKIDDIRLFLGRDLRFLRQFYFL